MRTLEAAAFLSVLGVAACGGVEVESSDAGGSRIDAAPAAPDAAADVLVDLVDDLEDGDNRILPASGRSGNWYVINDGTGTQEPFPDFAPTVGGAGDSSFSARTSGSGFTIWGAKVSFYLHHDDVEDVALPYDLGGYTGIQFQARGDITFRQVIVTTATLDEAHGGECVQDPKRPCDDYHGIAVGLTDSWMEYRIPFANLAQNGWGQAAALDLATAIGVEFEVENVLSFDVAIDDIAFYTEVDR